MLRNDNYAVVIPARFKSSRFPGKPLADIAGKSLVQRVWIQCTQAVDAEKVIVATDDERILEHCNEFGAKVVMTSESCLTGTDRVAEVVAKQNLDFAVNVQGDEPLVRPDDIIKVRDAFVSDAGQSVINAMAPIHSPDEFNSLAVPKVVFDMHNHLLYMSRAPIPGNKEQTLNIAWKQVCIYAFSQIHLRAFEAQPEKTRFENVEDIEILRFLELGHKVKMVEVESGTVAVDFKEDIEAVLKLLNAS